MEINKILNIYLIIAICIFFNLTNWPKQIYAQKTNQKNQELTAFYQQLDVLLVNTNIIKDYFIPR